MTTKSFKRTVITVEVLSDTDWDWETLGDVAYAITDGDCSGDVQATSVDYLTAEEVAKALIKQGSDPEFLLGPTE